jgi:hypothetical protein
MVVEINLKSSEHKPSEWSSGIKRKEALHLLPETTLLRGPWDPHVVTHP